MAWNVGPVETADKKDKEEIPTLAKLIIENVTILFSKKLGQNELKFLQVDIKIGINLSYYLLKFRSTCTSYRNGGL